MRGKRVISVILVLAYLFALSRVIYAQESVVVGDLASFAREAPGGTRHELMITALTNTVLLRMPAHFVMTYDDLEKQIKKAARWAWYTAPSK